MYHYTFVQHGYALIMYVKHWPNVWPNVADAVGGILTLHIFSSNSGTLLSMCYEAMSNTSVLVSLR